MKQVNVKSLGECPYLISLNPDDAIGEGSYGKIMRAYNKNNPLQKLVAKVFQVNQIKKYLSAIRELNVVSKLPSHENLVCYKKVKITSKNFIYIIMQECQRGTLKKFMQDKKEIISQREIWSFLYCFVNGYKILFQNDIIHRDIKPENILITKEGALKISDFGLAEFCSELNENSRVKGSFIYMAPELIKFSNKVSKSISNLNDIYSLGILLYMLCFKRYPFMGQTMSQLTENILNSRLKFPQKQTRKYSKELIQFISSTLQRDPQLRCTWQYIFLITAHKQKQYNLTHVFAPFENISKQSLMTPTQINLHIVQISDTFLQNLSLLDMNLYNSLRRQSVVIVDHLQAEILNKRDVVYYCDRIYSGLSKLQFPSESQTQQYLNKFCKDIIIFAYLSSEQLILDFKDYYSKLQKNQFLKLKTSKKYTYIQTIIKEDHRNLQQLLSELHLFGKLTKYNLNDIKICVYGQCSKIIQLLLEGKKLYYACQLDQLQQWFEDKNNSILLRSRKNDNALMQFYRKLAQSNTLELKNTISQRYKHWINE